MHFGSTAVPTSGFTFASQIPSMTMSMTWQSMVSGTLPGSRTRGFAIVALFAVIQAADLVLTLAGISRFGILIESNPLLAASMRVVGAASVLFLAKGVAVALATVLHVARAYLVLASLTVLYVFSALIPWALTLSL